MTERDVSFLANGETLRGTLTTPDGAPARGTLVLMHGLASESREFGETASRLASRGWAVLAFDRRGHGRSTGERGRLSRAWAVADTRAAVDFLEATPEAPAPFGIAGHSLGAAWSAAALAAIPELEAGVLAAPAARITDELGAAEFAAYRAANRVSLVKERLGLGALVVPYKVDYRRLFLDAEAARRAKRLAFLQRTVTLANFDELTAVDGATWARDVHQPVLVLLANHDRVVQNASSMRVFENLAGPKRLARLECGHSMFMDCLAEEAVEAVDAWFRERIAPTGEAAPASSDVSPA